MAAILCAAFQPALAMSMAEVTPPVMVPANDTGWVGKDTIEFDNAGLLQGRILYTLDGTAPAKTAGGSTKQYMKGEPIIIDRSCTIIAIHYQNGMSSAQTVGQFTRAHVPTPVPQYGGNPNFSAPLQCTFSIGPTHTTATIRYTEDGKDPDSTSAPYVSALTISKTETLKAFATAVGYDPSKVAKVDFTYLKPPAKPIATPPGQPFSTNTLLVRLKSDSIGVYFRATTDPNADLATLPILQGDSVTITGTNPGEVILLRAQAFKTQPGYPASPVASEQYTYAPAVAAPTAKPTQNYFYDTVTVRLECATPGATIRYTDDGSVPTAASKDGAQKIFLTHTTNIKAIALKAGQPNSVVSPLPYTLRLNPPVPDKRSQDFLDTLLIKFTSANPEAVIFYTLNGDTPRVVKGSVGPGTFQYIPAMGVAVGADSTMVRAMAYLDGIASDLSTNTYKKKTAIVTLTEPSVEPAGRDFEDTLSLRVTSPDSNTEIHYTLSANGTEPTRQSPKAEKNIPIRIDTSWVFCARAFQIPGVTAKRESSSVVTQHYVVTPSAPTASPLPGTKPFTGPIMVMLKSHTRGGIIYYTTKDADKDPKLMAKAADSVKVPVPSTCNLRAWAYVGNGILERLSPPISLHYDIAPTAASDTLAAGGTTPLSGGYSFTNNSALPIIARQHVTDGMGLRGFQNTSLAITLQPLKAGQLLNVTFTKPADQNMALYRYANGTVEFVSADSRTDLSVPGDYFVGMDTIPPVITVVSQVPKLGDSTAVKLKISDNVAGAACEITSPGITGGKVIRTPGADSTVTVNLKVATGSPKGLWLRAAASDYYNTTRMPSDGTSKYYVSQLWNKVTSPSVLVIGQGDYLWDMAGIPVEAAAPITWGEVRDDNGDPGMVARVWNETTQLPELLGDSSVLEPGNAFWLGSRTKRSSITLNHLRAGESQPDGTYRIRLKAGWNQVTSPSLDKVYWPITVAKSKSGVGALKAPYRFNRNSATSWDQCDSLEPWIGYYVYLYGTADMMVTLYTDAGKRPAAKVSSEAESQTAGFDMTLELARHAPIRLGARTWAQDAVGAEDEPDLPALDDRFSAWAQRGRRHLMTDMVRYQSGEVLHWNVVLDDSARKSAGADGTAGSGKLTVAPGSLPAGYQAWAVSTVRGLKFRLESGTELQLSGLPGDTLSIYAGPAEKLSAVGELARAVTRVERFAFALEKEAGAAFLRLELPSRASVDASVWSASGRLLTEARPGSLNPGVYRLRLLRGQDAQVGFLRLRVRSAAGTQEYSRPVVW